MFTWCKQEAKKQNINLGLFDIQIKAWELNPILIKEFLPRKSRKKNPY